MVVVDLRVVVVTTGFKVVVVEVVVLTIGIVVVVELIGMVVTGPPTIVVGGPWRTVVVVTLDEVLVVVKEPPLSLAPQPARKSMESPAKPRSGNIAEIFIPSPTTDNCKTGARLKVRNWRGKPSQSLSNVNMRRFFNRDVEPHRCVHKVVRNFFVPHLTL